MCIRDRFDSLFRILPFTVARRGITFVTGATVLREQWPLCATSNIWSWFCANVSKFRTPSFSDHLQPHLVILLWLGLFSVRMFLLFQLLHEDRMSSPLMPHWFYRLSYRQLSKCFIQFDYNDHATAVLSCCSSRTSLSNVFIRFSSLFDIAHVSERSLIRGLTRVL